MQSNILMCYISAEPLLLKAQSGFVRRHKSSAPFWLLRSSWQSQLFRLHPRNWDSPQIWLKFTNRLNRLLGKALAQWAGGHGYESQRRLLVTRTFRTLMEILSILLKVQFSQCLCFELQRKQSPIFSFKTLLLDNAKFGPCKANILCATSAPEPLSNWACANDMSLPHCFDWRIGTHGNNMIQTFPLPL